MTLGTHAVVGAAIASVLPNDPIWVFVLGFASHFLLDSIPHWDYQILSIQKEEGNKMNTNMKMGRNFFIDLFRIGSDAAIGLILSLIIFHNSASYPWVLLIGAIGAIIPDFLQFVYFKLKHQPLISLQKFHIYIHAENDLNNQPVKGIIYQIILITTISIAFKLLV